MSDPIKVGDTLWYVPYHPYYGGEGNEVTVSSIGRRWLYTGCFIKKRIDARTMQHEATPGYQSPGRCYLSRQHYLDAIEREKIWNQFVQRVTRFRPDAALTVSDIERASALLGME